MSKKKEEFYYGNPNVWLSLDPDKVAQRIKRIADRLEKVLYQTQNHPSSAGDCFNQEEN